MRKQVGIFSDMEDKNFTSSERPMTTAEGTREAFSAVASIQNLVLNLRQNDDADSDVSGSSSD